MQPFFMGARSTRWNPDARGLLLGLIAGLALGLLASSTGPGTLHTG